MKPFTIEVQIITKFEVGPIIADTSMKCKGNFIIFHMKRYDLFKISKREAYTC